MFTKRLIDLFSRGLHKLHDDFMRILLVAAIAAPVIVHAEYISLPLVSGGFSWEASIDGVNWRPAYPEYPNGLTIPFPATTEGVFMWYWDISKGRPTGSNGPNTVYFRSTFMITDLHDKSVGAWFAVDDWMNLQVNGESVATYQLELNFNNERQPIPKFIDFTDQINTLYQGNMSGLNTIFIEAHDGGPVAASRAYEWLFFDAHNVNTTPILDSPLKMGGVNNVPESSVISLLMVSLMFTVLLGINMRKTRSRIGRI